MINNLLKQTYGLMNKYEPKHGLQYFEKIFRKKGKLYKKFRGMGSIGAMSAGSANRYFQKSFRDKSKF